jgi:O-6-methylguanine DNA methyltransferase
MEKNIAFMIARASLTDFQKAVYRAAVAIPRGQTRTYAQIAVAIGHPHAVRAVGNALNRNPFAPAVPCHRVVRSDGTIGGFASGPRAKKLLLRKEGAL